VVILNATPVPNQSGEHAAECEEPENYGEGDVDGNGEDAVVLVGVDDQIEATGRDCGEGELRRKYARTTEETPRTTHPVGNRRAE